MAQRLDLIRQVPGAWADWNAGLGGLDAHRLLRERWPRARRWLLAPQSQPPSTLARALVPPKWHPDAWRSRPVVAPSVPDGAVDLIWSNMALHAVADPGAELQCWHAALAPDGMLFFSALGPDSLLELRGLYEEAGWPPPAATFTDMHDWGDWLVRAGFAQPVMDMERVTLTFASPERLLAELRGLGRNLHPSRASGLRGRRWHEALLSALARRCGDPLGLTFEIIYGHAIRPLATSAATVSVEGLRQQLRKVNAARPKT